jgi:uncharacterized membrane protein YgcG
MKIKKLIGVSCLVLFWAFAGVSQILPAPAPPTQTPISADFAGVVDYAQFVDATSLDSLNKLLLEVKQKTTASIVVLTLKTGSQKLERVQAEAYADLIYKEWKLTNTPSDNTILFLITVDETLQAFQPVIYRGKIMQEIFDPVKTESLLEKFFTPAIELKEYSKGIFETTWALAYIVAQVYQKTLSQQPPFQGDPLAEGSGSASTAFLLIGLVILAAFVFHYFKKNNPDAGLLSWLPGRRRWTVTQSSSWRGAFDRGNFGGFK